MNSRIAKTWEFLQKRTLAWRNPPQEQVEILPPIKEVPQQLETSTGQPHQQRTLQVFDLLERASKEGLTTYTDLIDYVRLKTGKGCSRKLISKWKRERGSIRSDEKEEASARQIQTDDETETEPNQVQANCETETEPDASPLLKRLGTQAILGKIIIATIAVGIGAVGIGLYVFAKESYDSTRTQTASQTQTPPPLPKTSVVQAGNSNSPKTLKFNLSILSPEDLRVKQNDKVEAGQVLADRVEERSRLTAQREALALEYQQIQSRVIPTPPPPVPVPPLAALPPISYAEEEAAIQTAHIDVSQAERAFQLQQQKLKTEPLEESAAVQKAAVEVENRQRLVNNQKQKITAIALLKDIPKSVPIHEQEVLKQKKADLKQATADYQQATAKLSAASQAEVEKLQQLGAALEKARAELQVAIAKLQTKKDQRAYAEYEASVTAARRAEEQNTAASNRSRQLLEAEQQQRDRSYQLAQVKAKINEVNNQLAALSVVTSPYKGVVKSVKIQRQTNSELSVELTLAINNNPTAAVSGSNSPNNTATTDQSVINIGSTAN